MTNFCTRGSCFVLMGGIAAVALGILAADRDPPFRRRGGWIEPPVTHRASRAEVFWDAERVRDCPGVVTRHIVDWKGDIWPLPTSMTRYSAIDNKRAPLSDFFVPMGAACRQMPGFKEAGSPKARYTARATYQCNFTHHWLPIVVDKPDIEFDIDC